MKKFMAMLLALVMALSLVACGQKADDTAKDDANTDNTDDSLVVLENVVDWRDGALPCPGAEGRPQGSAGGH